VVLAKPRICRALSDSMTFRRSLSPFPRRPEADAANHKQMRRMQGGFQDLAGTGRLDYGSAPWDDAQVHAEYLLMR
jgi:hypothetical protein